MDTPIKLNINIFPNVDTSIKINIFPNGEIKHGNTLGSASYGSCDSKIYLCTNCNENFNEYYGYIKGYQEVKICYACYKKIKLS